MTVYEFPTTQWSLILEVGEKNPEAAKQTLLHFCENYWRPIFCYIRHRGNSHEDSCELTQEFFLRSLQKNYLQGLKKDRGKFRSFLLTMVKRFLANEWDKKTAIKRGSGQVYLFADVQEGERAYAQFKDSNMTPERLYDQQWATLLLERVLVRLRNEWDQAGKLELFESLKPCLNGEGENYREIAARFNSTEGAIKVMIHRLKERYRFLLRQEIAKTVDGSEEVEEEIRHLISLF